MKRFNRLVVVFLSVFSVGVAAQTPTPQSRTLQAPETAFKIDEIAKAGLPPVTGDFVVHGNQLFDGWFLKADRIIFKSGARLVFSRTALNARRQFFVIARELHVEDAGSPGLITWERTSVPHPQGNSGQAATGPAAGAEGQVGGSGANGAVGITGIGGESAPALTLVVLSVPSSGPAIDFGGQAGGQGGQGQKGGSGGVGGWGNPASQNAVNCNRGAGNGAQGGSGGRGGIGGAGGRGGSGGSVTLISDAANLPGLSQRFRVLIPSGEGGNGGNGGPGGDGGPGGKGGQEARPWCQGNGSQGPAGGPGSSGGTGAPGSRETDGEFLVGSVSSETFKRLYDGH